MGTSAARFLPLATLVQARRGKVLPLPPQLARLYGSLRFPSAPGRPHVYSNFVSTLDGIVSLSTRGHAGGADISGCDVQDRMVMGVLRAAADAIIVGSGTLGADSRTIWTADTVCPELAAEYQALRAGLGRRAAPLNVIVSGSGTLDLRLPVFASGRVPALIVTTLRGAKRLRRQAVPGDVEIVAIGRKAGAIPAPAILAAVCRLRPGRRILLEGGPHLLGTFLSAGLIDEQFLTLAPQIAGRRAGDRRLSLVMGQAFAPHRPLWGTLVDARRGARALFLRYAMS